VPLDDKSWTEKAYERPAPPNALDVESLPPVVFVGGKNPPALGLHRRFEQVPCPINKGTALSLEVMPYGPEHARPAAAVRHALTEAHRPKGKGGLGDKVPAPPVGEFQGGCSSGHFLLHFRLPPSLKSWW
jgi:hypothetical protein